MEEASYNKVQYSEFTDHGKFTGNGQWVIRADTYTEAMAILEQIRKGTPGSTLPAPVVTPTPQTPPQQYVSTPPVDDELIVPCKGCKGATTYKTGFSKKNGKPWKGYFCNKQCGEKPYFVKD